MPRNASGTYTLPTGNPVSPGTTIESAWANSTLSDIGTELTNSLSRTGAGGMLAAFRLADGTMAAPGVAFLNETGTGFYRAGSGEMWSAVQGAQIQQYTVNGVMIPTGKTFTAQGASTFSGAVSYTGTLTGGTGIVNLGSGQLYKDAAGNLGIGTASPLSRLTIEQNGDVFTSGFTLSRTGADRGTVFLNAANNTLNFGRSTATSMSLDSSGNLGIGTSSPGQKLVLQGSANQAFMLAQDSTATYQAIYGADSVIGGAVLGSLSNHPAIFRTNNTERMRIDAAGNLGLGVVPSAWGGYNASAVIHTNLFGVSGGTGGVSNNAYFDGSAWRYIVSAQSTKFESGAGAYTWATAPSGAADSAISFTQAMTLDASGNLGVGTSPSARIHALGGSTTEVRITSSGDVTAGAASIVRFGGSNSQTSGYIGYGGAASTIDVWNSLSGSITFGTNNTERARIDSSGNLAVGDSANSAAARLYVKGSGATSGSVAMVVRNSTPSDLLYIRNDGYMTFGLGGTPMTLTSGGNLLVGTTSDSARASIESSGLPLYARRTAAGGVATFRTGDDAGYGLAFENSSGTLTGSVYWTATTTTYATSSDARLKENIADADSASGLIDAIKVRKFDWKEDGSHQRYGFVAQELLPVAPEAVSTPADDPDGLMGVDYSKLVPMLIKEIQSLRARVAALES